MLNRIAAVGLTLVIGLSVLGCSDSKSRGGFASTTAPSTSSSPTTTTGGTTTAPTTSGSNTTPVASGIPQAPASQGVPLDVFNRVLLSLWVVLRPIVLAQLTQAVSSGLAGQQYSSGSISVGITNITLSQTDMRTSFGLQRLDTSRIELRAPIQGEWEIALDADISVQLSVGSLTPTINLPIRLLIEDLTLQLAVDLDDSDPTRPVLQRVGTPQIQFNLRLSSTNSIIGQLTNALTQPANWIAQQAINLGLMSVLPSLTNVQGIPGPVVGAGAALLQDSGTQTPFQEVVANVDIKLRRDNLPHGTILNARMDQPQTDSWLDAYRNGGPGNSGNVTQYGSGGDSAIWTGMYLASQAYRYAATGESAALDNMGHTLNGIGGLLDVNGSTGLLARVAAPQSSVVGGNIARHGVFRSATIRGQTWVGRQGSKGISRDQYSGVFFGLAIAYELVPQVRPDCELRIRQMLDYLIRNDWVIDEDRPAYNGTNGSRGPTSWAGINYQKLAFLLIGHRMDPGRYSQELAQAGPLAETTWVGLWGNTFGIDHYYKFNLSHIGLFNYFRLETDVTRWQAVHRGYSMIQRYVGHHRNAHFDLIQTSIDPSTRPARFSEVREVMRRFLDRNHREVVPPVVDLSNVTWVSVSAFGYSNQSGGGFSVGTTTQQLPAEPLDFHQRRYSGNFHWQRDPFTPGVPNAGDPHYEKHGLDVVLPYWMGRHFGAF